MSEITFFAPGDPRPQGSAKAFVVGKRAVVTTATKGLYPWRATVGASARAEGVSPAMAPERGPVSVGLAFVFRRPPSHFTGKGALRSGAPKNIGKPDLDKLCRAVLDALTGVAWDDDSQVVGILATKTYAVTESDPAGVHVTLTY